MKLLLYSVSLFLAAIFFGVFITYLDLSLEGVDVKIELVKSAFGMLTCLLIVFIIKRFNLTQK